MYKEHLINLTKLVWYLLVYTKHIKYLQGKHYCQQNRWSIANFVNQFPSLVFKGNVPIFLWFLLILFIYNCQSYTSVGMMRRCYRGTLWWQLDWNCWWYGSISYKKNWVLKYIGKVLWIWVLLDKFTVQYYHMHVLSLWHYVSP